MPPTAVAAALNTKTNAEMMNLHSGDEEDDGGGTAPRKWVEGAGSERGRVEILTENLQKNQGFCDVKNKSSNRNLQSAEVTVVSGGGKLFRMLLRGIGRVSQRDGTASILDPLTGFFVAA